MKTFDIWLEDSQGRQFRRSNHYNDNGAHSIVWSLYNSMRHAIEDNRLSVRIKIQDFNY